MKPIRVLVADDHEIVRHGIRTIVQTCPNFEVCGEASDGRQAVQLASQLRPDIVVIDIGMPHLNGLDATRQIVQGDPKVKVLILTMHEEEQYAVRAIRAGARGYVTKTITGDELADAVRRVRDGDAVFSPRLAGFVLDAFAGWLRRVPETTWQ